MTYVTTYKDVDTGTGQRLQAFEVVDRANEESIWKQREAYTSCLNRACAGIRDMDRGMFNLDDASTILSALSAKLYEAGLNEVADEIDVIAGEIQP